MSKNDRTLYPILVTYVDANGKTHLPPDPPLRDGYPPWIPRPNEYERSTPLPRCPDVKCRRAKKCLSPHYGKYCQRTHLEAEEYRGLLADKIEALEKQWRSDPNYTPEKPGDLRSMKQALEEREAELHHEELLAFQTKWVEQQKIAAQKAKTARPPTIIHPNNRKITSC